ncbi:hypothetical protein [[Kitasatospora] papulosa]
MNGPKLALLLLLLAALIVLTIRMRSAELHYRRQAAREAEAEET